MKSKLLAEFIGTFILVFAGTGAIIVEATTGALGHVGVAMTWGLVVTAIIYTFGHISGAHFNPAVSIAFWSIKEFDTKELIPYIIVQILGAVFASASLYFIFAENGSVEQLKYLGATLPSGSEEQSFALEFFLTFFLMMIILGSAVHAKAIKSFAGIAIGATVGLEAIFAGPICGASMNPARSIAPAFVSGNFESLWIYIIATILGALFAGLVYRIMKEKSIS